MRWFGLGRTKAQPAPCTPAGFWGILPSPNVLRAGGEGGLRNNTSVPACPAGAERVAGLGGKNLGCFALPPEQDSSAPCCCGIHTSDVVVLGGFIAGLPTPAPHCSGCWAPREDAPRAPRAHFTSEQSRFPSPHPAGTCPGGARRRRGEGTRDEAPWRQWEHGSEPSFGFGAGARGMRSRDEGGETAWC